MYIILTEKKCSKVPHQLATLLTTIPIQNKHIKIRELHSWDFRSQNDVNDTLLA